MANLLTHGRSFCRHDAMKESWSGDQVVKHMHELANLGYDYAGDADSGLMLCASRVQALLPNARWLFIKSTPEHAAESYRRYFTRGNEYPGVPADADIEAIMALAEKRYVEARSAIYPENQHEVELTQLDDPKVMRQIWDWLVPGLQWSQMRYEMLDTLQVNVMPGKITVALLPTAKPENWKRETFYATQ